jgi:hypothetical protein
VGTQDFDRRAAELGITLSRRSLIKGTLGVGVAALAGIVVDQGADAARRGYSGPAISPGNGTPGWHVVVSLDTAGPAFVYSISQDTGGDPRLVRYTTTWKGVVYFEGSARPVWPIHSLSGSADKQFDHPGRYDFRAYAPVGPAAAYYGPWQILDIP